MFHLLGGGIPIRAIWNSQGDIYRFPHIYLFIASFICIITGSWVFLTWVITQYHPDALFLPTFFQLWPLRGFLTGSSVPLAYPIIVLGGPFLIFWNFKVPRPHLVYLLPQP